MNGWIKLHRKVLNNDTYRYDPMAWRVFLHLLLTADRNGNGTFGRKQLSLQMGNNEMTIYKALQRLSVTQMVTLRSNNKFTRYHICKWGQYQGNSNSSSNNQVTSGEQPSNNQVTHYKNKELRNKKKEGGSQAHRLAELLLRLNKENFDFIKKQKPSNTDLLEIDRLMRLDGYEPKLIEAVIKWSAQDDFWSRNILSGAKLRKQFERLLIEIKKSRKEVYSA